MTGNLNLSEEIAAYLATSDHWRRLISYIQDDHPKTAHVHSYVHTCVHPASLEEIVRRYFAEHGWPLLRRINKIRPCPGIMALHGIEPEGLVHFDIHWIYKKDAGLGPAHGVERDSNLLLWNRHYIDAFYRGFPFRTAGADEEDALSRYFRGEHWQEGLEIIQRDDVPPLHINVETSVHPDDIGRAGMEALNEKGWQIDYFCPNVFLMHGEYTGKVVFMGREPEKVFDIGWRYDAEAIIKPTTTTWMFPERVGYDVMTSQQFDEELSQNEYVTLTADEIEAAFGG